MGLFFYFILFAVACLYGWVSRSARGEEPVFSAPASARRGETSRQRRPI